MGAAPAREGPHETQRTRHTATFENLTLTQSVLQITVTARGVDRAKVQDAAAAAYVVRMVPTGMGC
jgi:hypothetical protein